MVNKIIILLTYEKVSSLHVCHLCILRVITMCTSFVYFFSFLNGLEINILVAIKVLMISGENFCTQHLYTCVKYALTYRQDLYDMAMFVRNKPKSQRRRKSLDSKLKVSLVWPRVMEFSVLFRGFLCFVCYKIQTRCAQMGLSWALGAESVFLFPLALFFFFSSPHQKVIK